MLTSEDKSAIAFIRWQIRNIASDLSALLYDIDAMEKARPSAGPRENLAWQAHGLAAKVLAVRDFALSEATRIKELEVAPQPARSAASPDVHVNGSTSIKKGLA